MARHISSGRINSMNRKYRNWNPSDRKRVYPKVYDGLIEKGFIGTVASEIANIDDLLIVADAGYTLGRVIDKVVKLYNPKRDSYDTGIKRVRDYFDSDSWPLYRRGNPGWELAVMYSGI